jgi:type IV pilus assembly protein PilA
VPVGKKYQPLTGNGQDFEVGTVDTSWRCLKFSMSSPIYYQYGYQSNDTAASGTAPAGGLTAAGTNSFIAWANGDLDGDSTLSGFGQSASVNASNAAIKLATEVAIVNEYE